MSLCCVLIYYNDHTNPLFCKVFLFIMTQLIQSMMPSSSKGFVARVMMKVKFRTYYFTRK
jgi:hypothetical protein